ncbi:MAG TPA: septal ring lytic transglycosylase RlpA family protein [Candidatus Limnocylindria bacterium]|nr:septal ring lytic transglycosylase RlpA family protein [Candidatus Limnocylindria bacterium]
MRSLYGRRFCLGCSAYGARTMGEVAGPNVAVRARAVPGRDEWLFRLVGALLGLLSPQRAPFIARTGVAVFGLSLLLPMFVSSLIPRPSAQVIVAATTQLEPNAVLLSTATPFYELPPLPDPIARPIVVTPVRPTPRPTQQPPPVRVAAVPIPITAVPAAPNGSVVVASWYGPGFYENRLPCWPWLKAQGLPIQFLPDTWGVAHKSLPCGTMVTLTHGPNSVTVPVVDRGPYIAGREFDLSPRVKAALGCSDLCTVVMQVN